MAEKQLTEEQIRHLAKLSQLEISSDEISMYADQLSEALDYVASLQELDLDDVEETSQVTGLENVFSADEIGKSLSRSKVLSQAPDAHNGYIKVKAIFEKESEDE